MGHDSRLTLMGLLMDFLNGVSYYIFYYTCLVFSIFYFILFLKQKNYFPSKFEKMSKVGFGNQ
jgi:hypothetical protein